MRSGRPFTGPSGKLKNATLEALAIDPNSTYATNLICWHKNEPTDEEIQRCSMRLWQEITDLKPRVIVALGALASTKLTGHKFSEARGSVIWSTMFDCWIISTYHPAAILRGQTEFIADLYRDLAKIQYCEAWDPKTHGKVEYEVVHDVETAQAKLISLCTPRADRHYVAVDVEAVPDTSEKNKFFDQVRCLAISDGDNTMVLPRSVLLEGLRWPEGVRWTFHNGMFDTSMLRKDLNVRLPIIEDTMLMSYSLDERGGGQDEGGGAKGLSVGIHGLKRLAREYVGGDFYDINTWSASDEELWAYNAKDAAYTARLAQFMYTLQLADGRVREAYETMMIPGANALSEIKDEGITIDRNALHTLGVNWAEEWIRLESELQEDAIKYGWPTTINPGSPIQVKKFITQYLQIQVPNTQEDTLAQYTDHPWIAKFARWKKLNKHITSYVMTIDNVVDDRGRIHPDPLLHGTRNGRLAYRRPAVMTIPQPSFAGAEWAQLRKVFSVDEDEVYLEADYITAEVWSAALWSNDTQMLADLATGDFHSGATESMFNTQRSLWTPPEWKKKRDNSKFVTFGVLYGRSAKSLHAGELNEYSLRECELFIERWHERYSDHWAACQQEIKNLYLFGEQEAPSGRKRRYYVPELLGRHVINQAFNFYPQTISHDHLFMALIELHDKLRQMPARILFEVHDSIHFAVKKEALHDVVPIIVETMQQPRWFDVGLPVELKVGKSWGELGPYDPAATAVGTSS